MSNKIYQYAVLKQRIIAGFIDRFIIFLLTIISIIFSTIGLVKLTLVEFTFKEFIVFFCSVLLVILLSYSVIFIIYYLLNDLLFGRSIGKRIVGLHMVDVNNMERISKKKALKHIYYRSLCELSILPYFVMNDKKQIFHDEKSNIIVIKYN